MTERTVAGRKRGRAVHFTDAVEWDGRHKKPALCGIEVEWDMSIVGWTIADVLEDHRACKKCLAIHLQSAH